MIPQLGLPHTIIIRSLLEQRRRKELAVLRRIHLLQTHKVRIVLLDLLDDDVLPVLPLERPGRRVPVHLLRRRALAQDVVAHDLERLHRGVGDHRLALAGADEVHPVPVGRLDDVGAVVPEVGDQAGRAGFLDELFLSRIDRVALDPDRL
jgi:hypothetical protein